VSLKLSAVRQAPPTGPVPGTLPEKPPEGQAVTVSLSGTCLVSVQLRSRYQNCTLYVDGRAVGSPPADLEMAVGTYRATIRCPDGQTYESNTFPIEAGLSNRKIDDYLR